MAGPSGVAEIAAFDGCDTLRGPDGRVRIAVGDEVIDASVRGKLANMAAALKN